VHSPAASSDTCWVGDHESPLNMNFSVFLSMKLETTTTEIPLRVSCQLTTQYVTPEGVAKHMVWTRDKRGPDGNHEIPLLRLEEKGPQCRDLLQ